MNVTETFLKLTSKTYPHGSESELNGLLPDYLDYDEFGNRYIQIGDSSCMFTSHLDTATSQKVEVKHVIEGNICKTDRSSILGADDKAGVTIMLWMIWNKIPGLYYFFIGEEVGCIGSKALANKIRNNKIENITKVISFDRRGTDSVITFQASSRCCSEKFAQALADELNKNKTFRYKPDPSGIWTDSAQFTSIYPECTNISVGYSSEHTTWESQNLDHLEQLADTCLNIDWEGLPVERDPKSVEYKYRNWSDYDWDNDCFGGSYYYPSSSRYTASSSVLDNKSYFWDEMSNYVSSVTLYANSSKVKDIELGDERLEYEKELIVELLEQLEVEYSSFTWDGLKLKVTHSGNSTVNCTREEISEFIHQLDFWKNLIEVDTKKPKNVYSDDDAWSGDAYYRDSRASIF